MMLPAFLSSLFHKQQSYLSTAEDAVILYLLSQINKQELIKEQLDYFDQIRKIQNQIDREISYVSLYFSLEKFITKQSPPVVKRMFTKAHLREEIRKSIRVTMLPQTLRLLFLSDVEQALMLFELGLNYVGKYILHNLGVAHLQQTITAITAGTILSRVEVTSEGFDFAKLNDSLDTMSLEEIIASFQALYIALYNDVKRAMGEKNAKALFTNTYNLVRERYDYDIISQFITVLPQEIAAEDRITFLSREELERKVRDATYSERTKREQLETIKKELEEKIQELHASEDNLRTQKENVEKKVEERAQELYKMQAQLESSIESLRIGFIMVDIEKNIITMNGSARLLLIQNMRKGHAHEVPVNSATMILKQWTMEDISQLLGNQFDLQNKLGHCIAERKPIDEKEVEFGSKILHMYLAPIVYFKKNEVIGAVILLEDITEAKVLERSKDEFFSIASHELRTPLTAIRGNTSLIMDYYKEMLDKDEKLKKMVEHVYDSSIRLIAIVNQFLDMSRLEQGKVIFESKPVDLLAVARDVVEGLEGMTGQHHVSVKVDAPQSPLPPVFADADRVKEVMVNLVGNSLRFTENGEIIIHFAVEAKVVRTFVTDTGAGIPLHSQSLLFRKFQQAGESILTRAEGVTRDTTEGTGLGLYISRLLIEGMGGVIGLDSSEEDHGTTFSFTLPIATKELEEQSGEPSNERPETIAGEVAHV